MKTALVVFLVLCSAWLSAGNSIFSYDGFPVQNYGRDIYSLGMGDTGSSDIFRYNTGYANPAMHNRSNRTLFATGILMGYTQYDSDYNGQKKSFWDDMLDFPYFNVSVPIGHHRLGAQFNSHSSGLLSNQITLSDGSVEKQSVDKYLYRADLIYSANLKNFNAGISGNFYFGHDNLSFSQTGSYGSFDTHETLVRDFKNPSLTVGVLQSFKSMALGAHYSMPVTLKGESVRSSIHETEPAQDYEYKLPAQFNLSFTALPFQQIKLATDISYEPWSQINDSYRDCLKAGVGLAYEPDPEMHKTAFMKLPLRVGASMRQLAFKDKDGENIDEMAVSCGLTFPLKREVNRIDLGLQYLKRGNLATNKLSDTSIMLMIGFTGFDVMAKASDRTAPRDIPVKEEF
ncbi:MAG: hypothetical protein RBS43_00450 [Candidatus Cloacimonas sp.]|jgi:hypothetical protein|nr:hypothetical protein [Candidatus Cloacimonas sp.]